MADSESISFTTTLLLAGKTATGFIIAPEVIKQLGAGKKPPVTVTINGYTYRNTVAVMGPEYMIGVSAEHRAGAKIAAGDTITVTLALDTTPRVAEVPEDFGDALKKAPTALAFFNALSYSNKQGFLLPIKDAKTPETRNRRIEKAIAQLIEGKV